MVSKAPAMSGGFCVRVVDVLIMADFIFNTTEEQCSAGDYLKSCKKPDQFFDENDLVWKSKLVLFRVVLERLDLLTLS
jgi:hypothetical protein